MGGCWGWRGRIGKVENPRGERVDELGPLPDLACASNGRNAIILLDANACSNLSLDFLILVSEVVNRLAVTSDGSVDRIILLYFPRDGHYNKLQ